jgi:predicted Fe-Mo cluster-binding NifX family protein
MTQARIAIPSANPGGLQATVHGHFGHCDVYTLVDVEGGLIAKVGLAPTVPHEQGGCLAAVDHLAKLGVTTLIAGGLGMRPLQGFNQAGIEVYQGAGAPDVQTAVKSLLAGELPRFTAENTCKGGHKH